MTVYKDDDGEYCCGYCDHWLDAEWDYCPDCGQRIDWSEVSDENVETQD